MIQILTLKIDDDSQMHFEALRQRHFPPERNQIPAHLTLFHHLPDLPGVGAAIQYAAEQQTVFPLGVTGLRSLGKGVAYTLASPQLEEVHRKLTESFTDYLTAQDKQRFMPHIVVQNKATSEQARLLHAELQRDFRPRVVQALGLERWEYLGGPWRPIETYLFSSTNKI